MFDSWPAGPREGLWQTFSESGREAPPCKDAGGSTHPDVLELQLGMISHRRTLADAVIFGGQGSGITNPWAVTTKPGAAASV